MTTLRLARFAMNCRFEVTFQGDDRGYLEQVASLALDEVASLDAKLSCFSPTSEVSFLNAEAFERSVVVSPDLFGLLQLAREVWRETDGAFDITAGPLIALWREAERTGIEPSSEDVGAALGRTGMRHVLLDAGTNSVRFDTDGIGVNLGAIGKGYAVRRAVEILREYGIASVLVSAGGSTVHGLGDGPDEAGWRVGIRHPSRLDGRIAEVELHDRALATSGGPAQVDRVVEERFEHIIDPRTGRPASGGLVSASVITPDAALSDALSTAFYLLGPEFATTHCRSHEGVEAILVEAVEGEEAFSVLRVP